MTLWLLAGLLSCHIWLLAGLLSGHIWLLAGCHLAVLLGSCLVAGWLDGCLTAGWAGWLNYGSVACLVDTFTAGCQADRGLLIESEPTAGTTLPQSWLDAAQGLQP